MENLFAISVAGVVTISVAFCLIVATVVALFCIFPFSVWWKALINDAEIPMAKLMAMKLRKSNLNLIVVAYITAKRSGIDLDISELETHVLAGGNIDNVVRAVIAAKSANINLTLQTAMAIDLAGRDVYNIVQTCITPKVIETPIISAVTKDGVEIKAKANITLKMVLKRVLGGADENTISLRVSEALSSTIGSAINHNAVIENPDVISDIILQKNLDYETSYEILSIDIFNMELGKNYSSQKRIEDAELEKKKMETEMEKRRLEAVVKEQENKARLQETKMRAIESEAEVPKALAKALSEGKISPVDYYDIQNLQADTELRNKLSGKKQTETEEMKPTNLPKPRIRKNPFDF